jgi:uncharacterized protein (DUF1800 family)
LFKRNKFPFVAACAVLLGIASSMPIHADAADRPARAEVDAKSSDLKMLNRISWGVDADSTDAVRRLGIQKYIEAQLHPAPDDGLPRIVAEEIANLQISKLSLMERSQSLETMRLAARAQKDPQARLAATRAYRRMMRGYAQESASRSLLRALYSRNQLKEQMAWFWLNHFNVATQKSDVATFVADYEDDIRSHALGKMSDLVMTSLHPAMLRYLDNSRNEVRRLNENYAREIMELHTMGVDGGYKQDDVQELARILTGIGINKTDSVPQVKSERKEEYQREGPFEFNPDRHDYGSKTFLGTAIEGGGMEEVRKAVTLMVRSPATARFISRKLAIYLVSDNPSEALVRTMSQTFQETDGDIAAVLRTLFRSAEFRNSLSMKFKDPMHYVVSAVRLTRCGTVATDVRPLKKWLGYLGQAQYRRSTPDGYPLTEANWAGSDALSRRFQVAQQISASATASQERAGPRSARPCFETLINPFLGVHTSNILGRANSREQRTMLILSSPEFMRR